MRGLPCRAAGALLALLLCFAGAASAGEGATEDAAAAPQEKRVSAAAVEGAPAAEAGTAAGERAPPPDFVRRKHELPELLLQQKREHRYMTPMPVLAWDPDTGLNLGALINFFDNGSRDDPLFRYAPYRQQIAVAGVFTTKKFFQVSAFYDQPYLLDTPWRVRGEVDFLRNPVAYYFGIGEAGQQLTFPGTGQVYGSFDDYQNALNQVVGGQTNARYDQYLYSRMSFRGAAEYDLFGGIVRPLIGFQVGRVWITDYTGDTIGGAQQLPTHLRDDCDAGIAKGCSGGFDNYVKLGITLDTRNFEPDPSVGILGELVAELSPRFLGSAFNYGRLGASLHGFGTVLKSGMQQIVLAGRFLYQWQFGDVPFYSMNTLAFTERDRYGLGGLRTLRGFRQDRFIGPVAMLTNAEMRWSFVEFTVFRQRIKLTATPFIDAGRTFSRPSDTSFKGWKVDGGAGLRMAWNLSTVVCFDYGISPEGSAFYMDLNHQF